MKQLIDGKEMDISPEMEIPLTLVNPIFNDQGSYGLGITLPGSQKNLENVGYQNRVWKQTTQRELPSSIEHGVLHLYGKATLNRISKGGIEMDMMLGEGTLYNELSEKKLSEVVTKKITYASNQDIFQAFDAATTTNNFEWVPFELCTKKEGDPGTEVLTIKNRAKEDGTYGTEADHASLVGYAPFLYLHYVLERIFTAFTLTMTENQFRIHDELKWLVLLNNAADLLVNRELDYSRLCPDMTCLDLISCVEDKYGCRFLVDYNLRQVKCIFLNAVHDATDYLDLSAKLDGEMFPEFENKRKLRLTSATSLDTAAPANTDYKNWLQSSADEVEVSQLVMGNMKVYYIKKFGFFARRKLSAVPNMDIKSSSFFPYESDVDAEAVEITTQDECVPTFFGGLDLIVQYDFFYPFFPVADKYFYQAPNEDESTLEPSHPTCPIAFCFYAGKISSIALSIRPAGSSFRNANSSNTISLDWIGSNGLYNNFYAKHDTWLQSVDKRVTCALTLSQEEISSLRWDRKVIVDNAKFFIDRIELTLLQSGRIRVDNVYLLPA